jgi:flagellar hook assembly protein FlgD
MPKRDIDAITSATPRTGTQSYRWDGTDRNGNRLAAGEYRIFLEATLRGENRVLYSASVTLGSGQGSNIEAQVRTEYFGSGTSERGMIDSVKVVYKR